MYSGGYRSDARESVQYPMQGGRQGQRISPWQRDEPVAMKKQDDERRDITRMQMSRDRIPDVAVDPKHSITPQRKSRSPVRRDRSPLRDRYKRHSPSPRSSHSPRRSWALEKRSSPEIRDAPPPPSWPGQKGREPDSFTRTTRTFPEREQAEGPKHVPVWQRPFGKDEDVRERRPDNSERRPFIEDKVRPTKEVPAREPIPHPSHSERFVQREPKFSPRDDFEADRRDAYRRREPSIERKPHLQREDYEQSRRPREHEERMHSDEYHRRREPSPRHDTRKADAVNPNIDKDFEDIYKRALQFKKKAEELRRLGSKKRDDYAEDEARSYHSEREREERSQRYEDRHRYREEEHLRLREREERPRDDRPRDDRLRDDRPRDDRPRDDRPRDDRTRDDRPRDDRPRDDRPRDDRPRDDRPRDDRPRDDRPRDDRPRDDRPRDDRPRDDRPRDDRPRDDRPRDDRPRDDRPRDDRMREDRPRDDRPRDDRPRYDTRPDDMRRPEFRPREEYSKQPEREQDRRFTVNPAIRMKRDKAIEEICTKLLDRHEHYRPAKEEHRARVMEELQLAIARIVFDMFGDNDVSFIEIIIKFQAKYTYKDEEKLLLDVMSSLPSHYRVAKRQAPESTEVPAKTARPDPSPNLKSGWNVDMLPPELVTMPMLGMQPAMAPVLPQGMVPVMVPAPFMHPYKPVSPTPVFATGPDMLQYQEQVLSSDDDGHKLYLCKDDFDKISAHEADLLKEFLISQMIKETEISQGWAPDFTLKGLQNTYRYEILTKDDITRDWLVNLDFNQFQPFHVLAYTKEELWYQRAAIWLPGHSRSRNIEPLDKLKLQNKKLEGVNIHTWKFVKKIVTQKGTRLYVDMPPASARALEKHKMMLSYELQKVNVFLKVVAVDKNVFDEGLKQQSTVTPSQISDAIQNSPMPSLSFDLSLVKITLKGCKSLSLTQARKIKEVLIYQMFRYHQQDGSSRTDFIKYGFFPPNSFGVIPQNPETKKWLLSQHLGKVNKQTIIVQGGQDEKTRYFRMTATVPNENYIVPGIVAERIKQSNQGVKGINFNLWKPIWATSECKKAVFEVDIDFESLETLSSMKYQLDYVDQYNVTHSVYFKSEHTEAQLEEMIKQYKAEMSDSYDVANMDLESDSGDDVICLD
ncbi:hypothetical protein HF086_007574 [Spodoptera exigua]|uniref:DUF4780 domain-containing protein n=1 Tax=Spodoptera exigua TaxID=7107 RepID=A0A922MU50_SPOEX|nr:hypothetical protein HF086_007574 [Spodoptera exigua]